MACFTNLSLCLEAFTNTLDTEELIAVPENTKLIGHPSGFEFPVRLNIWVFGGVV